MYTGSGEPLAREKPAGHFRWPVSATFSILNPLKNGLVVKFRWSGLKMTGLSKINPAQWSPKEKLE
jgi:hypothetical protein